MYVTINVMTVSMIRVRINVTTNVIATAASVDNESSWSTKLCQVLLYVIHYYKI